MTQVLKGRDAAAAFRRPADGLDLPDVGGGIFLVLLGVGRVMAAQAVPQVFHLPAVPIGARPDMLVIENLFLLRMVMTLVLVVLPAFDQGDARGGIHHGEIGRLGQDAVQEGFRPRAVDGQHRRAGKGDPVVGGELIIVQAAGGGAGQADHLHPLHPVGQVEGRDIHGIERGHNPGFPSGTPGPRRPPGSAGRRPPGSPPSAGPTLP